jgi:hypothetical protein
MQVLEGGVFSRCRRAVSRFVPAFVLVWLALAHMCAPAADEPALAAPDARGASLRDVLASGKIDLSLRLRYESARDATPGLKDAHAFTLRSALGYTTGSFRNVNAYVQVEDVRAADDDTYNDGGSNAVRDRAAIVDPEGTEINQAFLRWGGLARTVATLGRQELTHREAPLHRHLGNVGFRQNMQTYDALRVVNLSLPKTTIDYAYLWNANRVFGPRHPNAEARDFRMHSHALSVQHSGLRAGKLEGFAYLLDFGGQSARRFSTATFGARFAGDHVSAPKLRLSYAVEAARQDDYAGNPNRIGAHYWLAQGGARYALGGAVEFVAANLGYELLSGKGGVNAFQTPLGTNHAFQGAADRFLVTPGDGVRDVYLRLNTAVRGVQLAAEYHRLDADRGGYAYGDEWDFVIEKPFSQGWLIGAQYADYQAARNARNLARNSASGQAFDLRRAWIYLQFKY